MTSIEPLIGKDEAPFSDSDLDDAERRLNDLAKEDRWQFLKENTRAIAEHPDSRILIVAGAGTGKSTLFMDRVRYWFSTYPDRRIYVSTFVRKLVGDLENDLRSSELESDQKKLVRVNTLHHLARSILERSGGTRELSFGRYIQMISQEWKDIVWDDAVSLVAEVSTSPRFEDMETQFHEAKYVAEDPWPRLRESYFSLCRFYDAVGFSDSIIHATEAIRERPELNEHALWIFDEFQDFNAGEDALIRACAESADGILLAGDDDQALYQELKSSVPDIIRSYYAEPGYTKAMLPFCTRCSYHICMGASAFLTRQKGATSIRKIYLPTSKDADALPIQFVACAHPSSAVAYIEKFVDDKETALVKRRDELQEGKPGDPFLLILTPQTNVADFYYGDAEPLEALVKKWSVPSADAGEDYRRLSVYFRHARAPTDNFTFRKVLFFEGVNDSLVRELLKEAMGSTRALVEMTHESVTAAHSKCLAVARILEDTAVDTRGKVDGLSSLMRIQDPDELMSDLDSRPLVKDATPSDEEEGADEEQVETPGSASPVELMTMHKAKGLTADHVMLLGFDQVNMTNSSWQLFFVAMTRARHSLHLITALRSGGASHPHPFIEDIPEAHSTHLKFTKKDGAKVFDSRDRFLGFLEWVRTHSSKKAK